MFEQFNQPKIIKKISSATQLLQKYNKTQSLQNKNNQQISHNLEDQFSLIKNKKNFTVAIRIKPELNSKDNNCVPITITKLSNGQQLKICLANNKYEYHSYVQTNNKKFIFDKVFKSQSNNDEIFNNLIQKKLKLLQNGINLSIMAYGATNSGKTYTIFGKNSDSSLNSGLASMTFKKVFEKLSDKNNLSFSFVQIYNENIYDLLNQNLLGKPLNIMQDSQGNTNIIGLRKTQLNNLQQIQQLIYEGNNARISNSNLHNVHSSRSHALMQIQIKNKITKHKTKIVVVDLAGSEKYIYNTSINGNGSNLLKQGSNINKSLLSLGNCIKSLYENQNHIPFRDSKLTRLLKQNLNGYAHNIMITCIGQKISTFEENLNSLNYALKAMKIQKKIQKKTQSQQLSEYQCTNCLQKLPYALIKDINKHQEHNKRVKTRQSQSLSISPISRKKEKQNNLFFRSNQAQTSKNINFMIESTHSLIDQKFNILFQKMENNRYQFYDLDKIVQLIKQEKQILKNQFKEKFQLPHQKINTFQVQNNQNENNSIVVSEFQNTMNSINLSSNTLIQNKENINKNGTQKRLKISLSKPLKRIQRTASTTDNNRSNLQISKLKDILQNKQNPIRIQQDISESVSEIHSFRSNLTVNILDDKDKLLDQRKKVLEEINYNNRNQKKFNNRLLQFKAINNHNHSNPKLLDSTSIAPRMKRDEQDNIKAAWQSIVIKNIQSPDRNKIYFQQERALKQKFNIFSQQEKDLSRIFRY